MSAITWSYTSALEHTHPVMNPLSPVAWGTAPNTVPRSVYSMLYGLEHCLCVRLVYHVRVPPQTLSPGQCTACFIVPNTVSGWCTIWGTAPNTVLRSVYSMLYGPKHCLCVRLVYHVGYRPKHCPQVCVQHALWSQTLSLCQVGYCPQHCPQVSIQHALRSGTLSLCQVGVPCEGTAPKHCPQVSVQHALQSQTLFLCQVGVPRGVPPQTLSPGQYTVWVITPNTVPRCSVLYGPKLCLCQVSGSYRLPPSKH